MARGSKSRSVKPKGLRYKRSMGPVGGRRSIGHGGSMTHRKYGKRGGR